MALENGIAALDQYRSQFENTDLFPAASAEDITAAQLQLKNALGLTDYSTQSEAAKNTARLNMALALAQRGFEMAGATPREGESPISTMSRAIAPLAGDVQATASDYMKQKAAFDLAQQQEKRQIKLLGYQSAQARRDKQSSALASLLPELIKGPDWTHQLLQQQDFSIPLGEGDNQQTIKGRGSLLFSKDDKGNTQAHTATAIEGTDADGKPVTIPQGTPVPAFSKYVKPSEDKYGAQTLWQNVSPLTVSFMRQGERITVAPGKSVLLDKNELGIAKRQLASQDDPRNFADVFRPLAEQTLPAESFIANVWDGEKFNQRKIVQQTKIEGDIPKNIFYVEHPVTKTLSLVEDHNTIVAARDNQLPFKLSKTVYVTDENMEGLPEGVKFGDEIDIYISDPKPGEVGGTQQKRFVSKGDIVSIGNAAEDALSTEKPTGLELSDTLYAAGKDMPEGVLPRDPIDVMVRRNSSGEVVKTEYWHKGKPVAFTDDQISALSAQELKDWQDRALLYAPEGISWASVGDEVTVRDRTNAAGELETSYWHKGIERDLTENEISLLRSEKADTPALERQNLFVHDAEAVGKALSLPGVATNAQIIATTQTLNGEEITKFIHGGEQLNAETVQQLKADGAIQTVAVPAAGESKSFIYTGSDIPGGPRGEPGYVYGQKIRVTPLEMSKLPKPVRDNLQDAGPLSLKTEHFIITEEIDENGDGEPEWVPGDRWYGDATKAEAFREKHGDVITNWDKGRIRTIKMNTFQKVFTQLAHDEYPQYAGSDAFKLTEDEKISLLGQFPSEGRGAGYWPALKKQLLRMVNNKVPAAAIEAGANNTEIKKAAEQADQVVQTAVTTANAEEKVAKQNDSYEAGVARTLERARTRDFNGYDALYGRDIVTRPWDELSYLEKVGFSRISEKSDALLNSRTAQEEINKARDSMLTTMKDFIHPTPEDSADFSELVGLYANLKQLLDGGYLKDTGMISGIFSKLGANFADWDFNILGNEDTDRLAVIFKNIKAHQEKLTTMEGRPSNYRIQLTEGAFPDWTTAETINDMKTKLLLTRLEDHIQGYFDPAVTARRVIPRSYYEAAAEVGIEVADADPARTPWIDPSAPAPQIRSQKAFMADLNMAPVSVVDFTRTYVGQPLNGFNVPEKLAAQLRDAGIDPERVEYRKMSPKAVEAAGMEPVEEGMYVGLFIGDVRLGKPQNVRDQLAAQFYLED